MSTESVSSDSSIQAAQLVEDQLSEDELETVVGGTLDLISHPNKPTPTPAGGGNRPMPKPSNGASPTGPLGNQSKPDIYDTFTS